jgi:hypothetical protein
VGDIFIIYDQNKITPESILELFNKQHRALQFTITEKKYISYLDLNILNRQGTICRNPTTDVQQITLATTPANIEWPH